MEQKNVFDESLFDFETLYHTTCFYKGLFKYLEITKEGGGNMPNDHTWSQGGEGGIAKWSQDHEILEQNKT